ncbi:hypothetical protein B0H13DRAFT_1918894 [Mycena leptocephala]|nr:hypothetical protein B0H13DRAFT_1918894 [Mycena leptocephala]
MRQNAFVCLKLGRLPGSFLAPALGGGRSSWHDTVAMTAPFPAVGRFAHRLPPSDDSDSTLNKGAQVATIAAPIVFVVGIIVCLLGVWWRRDHSTLSLLAQDHTYDCQQPYGAAFYKDVTTKQWFDSLKSEGVRTQSFEQFVDSPVPVITLVTGAMENSLKEYASGVRVQIKFTEEEFAPRYQHHRASLLNLQSKSPTWFAQFQRNLYVKIVSSSNFPHLKRVIAAPEEDEFEGVDFEALEASAIGDGKSDAPVAEEPAAAGVGAPLAVAA